MKKYTLYVGLNDKDSKVQKVDTLEAFKLIENLCTSYTDGATIFEAKGVYKHENGAVVWENTFKIELLFVDITTVKEIANTLKRLLNQESIALTIEEIQDSVEKVLIDYRLDIYSLINNFH